MAHSIRDVATVRALLVSALFVSVLGLTLTLAGCGRGGSTIAGVPEEIDYNWHVRPILSENCFRCHGPDAGARKAGLRLDVADAAYAELKEAPGRYAIVPGAPDRSELIRRITHPDPEERMPPPELHKVLTDQQVAILREWIDDGAEYKPHWAYISPGAPRIPRTEFSDRAVNEIDRFVFSRLEHEGLAPSSEADKETLINRASLTLTGLPPTLAEVDAFLADTSPNAYENVVDRLLGSKAYAEHMASYWMNLGRWAESDGFLDDHHDRFLWPWRDWVIGAFDRNMPFDQFATWQIAGDVLPNATREQTLATAFMRLGKRTTENGAIDEEYRVEYVIDRTNTVGTAFLGLTVACAQCHDHKYDAISQRDYYSLSGFFNSIDEPGFYAPGQSGIQGGPTLPWPDAPTQARIKEAEVKIAEAAAAHEAARKAAAASVGKSVDAVLAGSPQEIARLLRASLERATVAHYPFDSTIPLDLALLPPPRPRTPAPRELVSLQPENMFPFNPFAEGGAPQDREGEEGEASPRVPGFAFGAPSPLPSGYVKESVRLVPSALPGSAPALIDSPVLREGAKGRALFFTETNKGTIPSVGWHDRTQPFSLDLRFYVGEDYKFHPNEMLNQTGKGLPYGVPIVQHRDDDNSGGAGYRLQLEDGFLWVYLAHSRPANMIALRTVKPFPVKRWVQITLTYDGSSRAAGTKLYLDGQPADVVVDHDTLTRSMLPMSYNGALDAFSGFSFGSRFREKAPVGSGLDELRFFNRDLQPLEVAFLHDEAVVSGARDTLRQAVADVAVATDARVAETRARLTDAREAHNKIVTLVPQVLVLGDAPTPRPPHRLDRGLYSQRAEEVPIQALTQVFPWDESLPRNRVGLAQWLFDPEHPLTARVFVNRMWQRHFGMGLVETSEDFGVQGAIPTHPELLDWLALRFVESGWDVKQLHKLIVMSATYRQSSDASAELIAADPQNELLARGPRRRMPAEMVRDNALAASGLLVRTIGGESVHPYQPVGIWNPLNSFRRYPAPADVPADEHHRRTMYTVVKRNAVHPQMQIFDGADPNLSTPRRRVSNTPLQALELMNDPQFIEAYRRLAAQAMQQSSNPDAQLTTIHRLATRRRPTAAELSELRDYLREERAIFEAEPEQAAALLSTGVTPVESALDRRTLAALTNVTALVMNSPDAYSIR